MSSIHYTSDHYYDAPYEDEEEIDYYMTTVNLINNMFDTTLYDIEQVMHDENFDAVVKRLGKLIYTTFKYDDILLLCKMLDVDIEYVDYEPDPDRYRDDF